jgi:hypothetical protein
MFFTTDPVLAEHNPTADPHDRLLATQRTRFTHYRTVLDMDSTEIPVYGEHYGKSRVMVRDACNRRQFLRQSP